MKPAMYRVSDLKGKQIGSVVCEEGELPVGDAKVHVEYVRNSFYLVSELTPAEVK